MNTNDPKGDYTLKPMLSDEDAKNILKNCAYNPKEMDPVKEARSHYEALISSGALIRREELVEWLEKEFSMPNRGALFTTMQIKEIILEHINEKP